jgi:hypothetical protein
MQSTTPEYTSTTFFNPEWYFGDAPFIYTPGIGAKRILPATNNWALEEGVAINDKGQIAAVGYPSPVPSTGMPVDQALLLTPVTTAHK